MFILLEHILKIHEKTVFDIFQIFIGKKYQETFKIQPKWVWFRKIWIIKKKTSPSAEYCAMRAFNDPVNVDLGCNQFNNMQYHLFGLVHLFSLVDCQLAMNDITQGK